MKCPRIAAGWYDYLCPLEPAFDDPVAERRLPDKEKRSLHRYVCEIERLPPEPQPDAVVTPDGTWHGREVNILDYWSERGRPDREREYYTANAEACASWSIRCAKLLAAHPYCWAVAFWAHS